MSKPLRTFAAAVLAAFCLSGPAISQANFPQVMPADTVYGSQFVAGPGEAISFSVLAQRLFNAQVPFVSGTPQAGWVPQATSSTTAAWAPGRIKLTAALTLNADASAGADVPTCGLTTGAGACRSVNYALNNILVPNYDTGGKPVIISFVNDDATCVSFGTAWTGGGQLFIQGPGGSPPSVGMTCAAIAIGINAPLSAALFLTGFKISGGTTGIFSQVPGFIVLNNINFGAESVAHINLIGPGSKLLLNGNYTISGGATYHWLANSPGALIATQNITATLTGTPAFGLFAVATDGGGIQPSSLMTFSGTATGARIGVSAHGYIATGTGNVNFLPGNSAGAVGTAGYYN